MVAFEGAVAGGVPIIKALREGLTANRIEWIAGIINGTSNFILSTMRESGASFETALKEAQARGYAEADPTFDVDGIDAAHKLTIMSAIAFGVPMQFDKAYAEGISKLTREDLRYAEQLGYRIKLLGITRRAPNGIELRVHPTLIPAKRLIANVEGAMNAVLVKGDAVGATLYYGAGAGAEPTASAVIADLVDVTRMHTADPEHRVPHLAFQPDQLTDVPFLPMGDVETSYYLRMRVLDRPGVLADITRILADREISIDAMIQKEPTEGEDQTDIILLTHKSIEHRVVDAIERIEIAADSARHGRAHPPRRPRLNDARRTDRPRHARIERGALMRYVSTRGAWRDDPQPFRAILLEGLAPDGGLAVPQAYPRLTRPGRLRHCAASLSRISRSPCFRSSSPTLRPTICARLSMRTYTAAAFGEPRITPLTTLEPGLHLLHLSNGPTLAFKDVALQLLGNLFEHVLRDSERTLNILGATSGDTGSSAEYAMRGKRNLAVFMLSPHGRMSAFQQAQMYALDDPNIHNLAIEGTFDDCQDIVKADCRRCGVQA